jgi:xanthine dehydrogenase small subunit
MIRFLLNNEIVSIDNAETDLTVLRYLRELRALTGTKEGCAAGDCGACTVVLAELSADKQQLHYRAINSCVTFLSALHGKQLITVEHLSDDQQLHPVQQAIVDDNASQCGFCTPGFVMSMFAFYHSDKPTERDDIDRALSGNLCRCTGYRPIIDAAEKACSHRPEDKFSAQTAMVISQLTDIANDIAKPSMNGLMLPQNRHQLAQCINKYPDAKLVAGSTDLALAVTQQHQRLDKLISLSRVVELSTVKTTTTHLVIGAAVPLSDFRDELLKHYPSLAELFDRFASTPIRNQATLGGNVANASPIGDMPPVLLALNAQVGTDNGTERRTLGIDDFFTGYRQTLLQPDEWIEYIAIPLPKANQQVKAYKISKRLEDDISAVCAVFALTLDDNKVTDLRTGFGGVAATPASCQALSDSLQASDWMDNKTCAQGRQILASAFNPISDVRASAEYRKKLIVNLWRRFYLETTQTDASINIRVGAHA